MTSSVFTVAINNVFIQDSSESNVGLTLKEINHLPAPYFLFENFRNFQRAIFVFWNLLPPYFFVQKHFQIFLVDFRQFFWNYRNMLFIEFLWFLAHLENPGRNSSWKLVMNISEIHRWKSTKLHYSQLKAKPKMF